MTAIASNSTTATSSDSLLRLAMRLDAILVGVTGVIALPFVGQLSTMTGVPRSVELGLAIFFVAYGVVVFALSRLERVRAVGIGTVVANAVSTVAAVAVVVTDVWPLTTVGVVGTLAMGVYTAVFAEFQYMGVRRI